MALNRKIQVEGKDITVILDNSWKSVYNPDFNYGEFAIIKSQAGLNSCKQNGFFNSTKLLLPR